MEFSHALCLNDNMQAFRAERDGGRGFFFPLNFYLSNTKFCCLKMSAGANKQQKVLLVIPLTSLQSTKAWNPVCKQLQPQCHLSEQQVS